MNRRIFQYVEPHAKTDDDTRWIAAWNMQSADDIAKKRGWVKEHADNEILQRCAESGCYETLLDYAEAGCDLVEP